MSEPAREAVPAVESVVTIPTWTVNSIVGGFMTLLLTVAGVGVMMYTRLAVIESKLDSMEKRADESYLKSDSVRDFQLRDERDRFLQAQIEDLRNSVKPK